MDGDHGGEVSFLNARLAIHRCVPALDYPKTSFPAGFVKQMNPLFSVRHTLVQPISWQPLANALENMRVSTLCAIVIVTFICTPRLAPAQQGHMHGMDHGMAMPMDHMEKMPPASTLKPAMGASVKILSPKPAQVFSGDEIPLELKMVNGKIGTHVHAYVDGELMGMFDTEKGTLTGVKPGQHTLEVRVVTADHKTELKATDTVRFTVK
jgi:hypothetical protein